MAEVTGYASVIAPSYLKETNNRGSAESENPVSPLDGDSVKPQRDVEVILSFEQPGTTDDTYQNLERSRQPSVVGELTAVEQRARDDIRFEQQNRAPEPAPTVDLEETAQRSIDVLI